MQPASAGGSVRLAMSSVYATSKCMLDYYRKGNMARDEPQLVRELRELRPRHQGVEVARLWECDDHVGSHGGPQEL